MLRSPLLPLELSKNIVARQSARSRLGKRRFSGRIIEEDRSVVASCDNHPPLELGLCLTLTGIYPRIGRSISTSRAIEPTVDINDIKHDARELFIA